MWDSGPEGQRYIMGLVPPMFIMEGVFARVPPLVDERKVVPHIGMPR